MVAVIEREEVPEVSDPIEEERSSKRSSRTSSKNGMLFQISR
jgi:hypothetical protein